MSTPDMQSDRTHYLQGLDQVRDAGPDWAKAIRAKYAARFSELEFPHRKMEEWRFTNVSPILKTPFAPLTSPTPGISPDAVAPYRYGEPSWTELVFIDGFFAKALSRIEKGVQAGSLAEAMLAQREAIEPHLSRYVNGTSNAFSALNSALLLDGAFIHVPKDSAVDAPIHLLFINTRTDGDTAVNPRNLVILERGAKASVVESHVSLTNDAKYLSNGVTEISVGENASLHWYKLIQESGEAFHLATAKARLDRGASFESYAISQSGKIIRNEIGVQLDGESAHASLKGLYTTSGDQLVDNPIAIEHIKPHCTSWIGYKGVLDDKSHAVFSGKVYVHRAAQKTDSNQLNQNLVRSEDATIDTKPLLEIFADDVKCTHGATVGRPPEELVFYFRTRGMSEAMALGMLTYGFADEVVEQIAVDSVRARLQKQIFDKYSPIPG